MALGIRALPPAHTHAQFYPPCKRRFMCFTRKSPDEVHALAYSITQRVGLYHPSRHTCNDGAVWFLRELCTGGMSIDGRVLSRRAVRTPKSAKRLRHFLEVTTLSTFHWYWDYQLWRAGNVYEWAQRQFRVQKLIFPPIVVAPKDGRWISEDRDGWAELQLKLAMKRSSGNAVDPKDYSMALVVEDDVESSDCDTLHSE